MIRIILFLIVISNAWAEPIVPLPAHQAFNFSTNFTRANEIVVEWSIAPGYFLYAQKMHFSLQPNLPVEVRVPQGDFQYDKERGRFEAFSGNLSIPVFFSNPSSNSVQLNIDYQGCSQDGFCYPPMHQTLLINLADQSIQIESKHLISKQQSFLGLLTQQNAVEDLLKTAHFSLILFVFLGLGLLLTLTPCVWPMIPILASIIAGQKESINSKKAFMLSLLYVLGVSMIYAAAGLVVASLGNSLQVWLQQPWVIVFTSVLFLLLALSLFGCYELQLPHRWQNQIAQWTHAQRGGTYTGAFLMGAISTLIVSPCVTAPLVGVLMYIAHTGDRVLGASALFIMGIGMGLPLLLIGSSMGRWLPRGGLWMEIIKKIFGVVMLAMAIWLLSRILSFELSRILFGMLIVGVVVVIMIYLSIFFGWPKWRRNLGIMVGCTGIVFMFASFNPTVSNKQVSSFIVVNNITELNQQLSIARVQHKPILLDFYADWCESCVIMDKKVFAQPEVKGMLRGYVLLRVDLSKTSEEEEALLKHFKVIAPPTILFFNARGQELYAKRIVGEVNAKEFLERL